MATQKATSIITVSIDEDVRISLDTIAGELDLTISKLARNLIYATLDDYQLPEKFGLGVVSKRILAFRSQCKVLEKQTVSEGYLDEEQEFNAQISVVIDTEVKESLEHLSKVLGIPVKMLARNFIYIGLRDFKLLKKVGIVQAAVAFDSFMRAFFKRPSDEET